MEDLSYGGFCIIHPICIFSSVIAAFWKCSLEPSRLYFLLNQPTSPEVRLQVDCSLVFYLQHTPCFWTVHWTKRTFQNCSASRYFLNKNIESKFYFFVDYASFQSQTAKLELFEFCKLCSMVLSGFCGFSSGRKQGHFCGFSLIKISVQNVSRSIWFCHLLSGTAI